MSVKHAGWMALLLVAGTAWAGVQRVSDIAYYPEAARTNDYQRERCTLDVRYPDDRQGFATLVWFHGGGLSGGGKHFVDLKDASIAQVAVNYRLTPRGHHPDYIRDAAAAVAWTLRHIAEYGGDPKKVFVAGHSAGGDLTCMVGMDRRWLGELGIDVNALAGLIPISAQVTTHFNVKQQLNLGEQFRPLITEDAPLYHAAKDLPPICLILGDRRIEWKCRVEENELLAASLRALGHPKVEFYELGGMDHGTVAEGGMVLLRRFIQQNAK